MSDGLPPLPRTADPFELLGVDRDTTDDRSLRRAYIKLIKVYKPERAPGEFQRVRQAYESAKRALEIGGAAWLDHEPAGASGDDAPDMDADEEAAVALPHDTQREVQALLDRDDADADAELAERLHRGDPIGALVAGECTPERTRRIAAAPSLSWDVFARQPSAAAGLMRARIDALLLAGDVPAALAEARTPGLATALVGNESLEHTVMLALCAGTWDNAEEARELHDRLFGNGGDHALFGLYSEIRSLSEPWRRAHAVAPCPPALARALKLGPLLDWSAHDALWSALAAMSPVDRGEAWNFFEAVADQGEQLTAYVHATLLDVAGADDPPVDLSSRLADADRRAQQDDKLREAADSSGDWKFFGIAALAGYLASLLIDFRWAYGITLTIAIGFWVNRLIGTMAGTRSEVRRDLRDLVDATGVGVEALVAATKPYKHLREALPDLWQDDVMELYAVMSRARLAAIADAT